MSKELNSYEEELIENLKSINHLTGNKNIIVICNKAATYISNAEKFRLEVENECKVFNEWSKRIKSV